MRVDTNGYKTEVKEILTENLFLCKKYLVFCVFVLPNKFVLDML